MRKGEGERVEGERERGWREGGREGGKEMAGNTHSNLKMNTFLSTVPPLANQSHHHLQMQSPAKEIRASAEGEACL